MVGVGVMTALLNISVQLIVVVAERILELTLKGFAVSRLKTKRRAPIIHDNDAWLLNVPCSIWKYYHHPGRFNIRFSRIHILTLYYSIADV